LGAAGAFWLAAGVVSAPPPSPPALVALGRTPTATVGAAAAAAASVSLAGCGLLLVPSTRRPLLATAVDVVAEAASTQRPYGCALVLWAELLGVYSAPLRHAMVVAAA